MSGPTLVPSMPDETVHAVLDDLGTVGRVWREIDEEKTSERNIVEAILGEQFDRPVRVVAFNLAEGWSRDVSEDIARNVAALARQQGGMLGPGAAALYEWAKPGTMPGGSLDISIGQGSSVRAVSVLAMHCIRTAANTPSARLLQQCAFQGLVVIASPPAVRAHFRHGYTAGVEIIFREPAETGGGR